MRTVLKRIKNEEKFFLNDSLSSNFKFYFESLDLYKKDNLYEIKIINKNNNSLEVLIKLYNDYPFKAPNLCVMQNFRNKSYTKWNQEGGENVRKIKDELNLNEYDNYLIWFFTINQNYLNLRKKIEIDRKFITCFCCDTILCSDKWIPTYKICDILREYLLRKIYFNNYNKIKIVKNNYLYNIFHNERWNLPEEIIFLIYNFIFSF